ncbi:MAG: DNA translocase FtsK [Opitutae bacterium]|nr:DNA translocase FtsK [Opitutae bacterium]
MPASKNSSQRQRDADKKSRKNSAQQMRDPGIPDKSAKRIYAFVIFFLLGIFALASLLSFTEYQKIFFSESLLEDFVRQGKLTEQNSCGAVGATFATIAFNFLGFAAYLLPVFFFLFAYYMLRAATKNISLLWKTVLCFLALCSGTILLCALPDGFYGSLAPDGVSALSSIPRGPGGMLGKFLSNLIGIAFGVAGTATLAIIVYFASVFALLVSSPLQTIRGFFSKVDRSLRERSEAKQLEKLQSEKERERRRIEAIEVLQAERNESASGVFMNKDAPVALVDPPHSDTGEDSQEENPDPFAEVKVDKDAVALYDAPVLKDLDAEENSVAVMTENENENPDKDWDPKADIENTIGVLKPLSDDEPEPPAITEATPENVEAKEPEKAPEPPAEPAAATAPAPEENPAPAATPLKVVSAEMLERANEADIPAARGSYVFPPIDLLAEPAPAEDQAEDYEARGQEIIRALAEFRCPAEMSSAQVGPTITRYEIKPGAGVKAERILNLQNNVAMALRATSARLAPVPENGTIGIEVPNRKMQSVPIREVLESKAWHENKMEIPAVLGKDVTGKPVLIDLAKMPHGLIAGSSGSGKSVCLNGIITSILYHASPEEVRLVMVDPKVVELRVYNDAPHMLIPVITDMKRAPGALKWLIDEMERRYLLLEEAGVRNIVGFNAKIERDREEAARLAELAANSDNGNAFAGVQGEAGTAPTPAPQQISVPRDEGVLDEIRGKRKMSYIVCIIDEFADIMAQNAAEIETGVARLTAKARAAGIHLILATQRPDAKTVTGLIKANLGTRIALRVTSGTNSRIILDEVGAETLIGKGDMLILGPGSPFPQRAQGVWVSEEEIEKIVQFLAEKNGKPKYAEDVNSKIDSYAAADDDDGDSDDAPADDNDEESLLRRSFELIQASKRASISYLQLKLKIGYGKAARIMDELEERGYVGESLGASKPREILRDKWEG